MKLVVHLRFFVRSRIHLRHSGADTAAKNPRSRLFKKLRKMLCKTDGENLSLVDISLSAKFVCVFAFRKDQGQLQIIQAEAKFSRCNLVYYFHWIAPQQFTQGQIMLPRKQLESGRNKQKTSGQGKFARNAVFGPCFFPDRHDDLPSNPVFESQNNKQDLNK